MTWRGIFVAQSFDLGGGKEKVKSSLPECFCLGFRLGVGGGTLFVDVLFFEESNFSFFIRESLLF